MLPQVELVDTNTQVIPFVEAEAQLHYHLAEIWGCDNGSADTHPSRRVIKILLKCCQLLYLGGVCQCIPYRQEQLVFRHLGQAEEVG